MNSELFANITTILFIGLAFWLGRKHGKKQGRREALGNVGDEL